jgi:hypothetical protein
VIGLVQDIHHRLDFPHTLVALGVLAWLHAVRLPAISLATSPPRGPPAGRPDRFRRSPSSRCLATQGPSRQYWIRAAPCTSDRF